MKYSIIEQITYELKTIFTGYPKFVFSLSPANIENELPVFVFHTIAPETFEAQLAFLKENGYRTLSVNAFVRCLRRETPVEPKSVLLTIDDARSSVWSYAFPLLKKYQMRATVFAIPGRTRDAAICRQNLENVWQNQAEISELYKLDPDDRSLCTWPEIRQMYDSGLVDIESHTLFHREVFVGLKIVDFVDESTLFAPYNSPVTPYLQKEDIGRELQLDNYLGMPLFESAPLMAGKPALRIKNKMLAVCKDTFAKQVGGSAWKDKLRADLQSHLTTHVADFQQNGEVESALAEDLAFAKKIIQKKLDNRAGNHLCLPYTVGSEAAIAAAKKTGMQSCFWGTVPGRRINVPGNDPFHSVRIKNDFIWRLPGQGRKSLFEVYGMKIKRRLNKEQVY
ncbi:MAG: polysaccharide deacetylase family protein [bacterium]